MAKSLVIVKILNLYIILYCTHWDLNLGPSYYKAPTLPSGLFARSYFYRPFIVLPGLSGIQTCVSIAAKFANHSHPHFFTSFFAHFIFWQKCWMRPDIGFCYHPFPFPVLSQPSQSKKIFKVNFLEFIFCFYSLCKMIPKQSILFCLRFTI